MTSTIHHLAFTAANLQKGAAFYDAALGVLGYQRGYDSDQLITWTGPTPEILLYAAESDDTSPHQHGHPGLQHAAFQVDNRATVDAVHTAVVVSGGVTIHEPRDYDYSPGYYAVFVQDPDGTRLEFAHIPAPTH